STRGCGFFTYSEVFNAKITCVIFCFPLEYCRRFIGVIANSKPFRAYGIWPLHLVSYVGKIVFLRYPKEFFHYNF
ncbi:hypothetical protein GIB67_041935, partial [Kingdonia uniflora]